MIMMYGMEIILPQTIKNIMIEYGDEKMMQDEIIDERIKVILQKDNDHVQNDGMCLVHENGDF
jgi:hypothetical protein